MKVLLVDADRGRAALLQQALRDADYEVVSTVQTGDDLFRLVQQTPVDVVLINMDSPDRDILEHLASIHREHPRPVVMFSNDADQDVIRSAVRAGVSAYVVDGFSEARLKSIMQVAIARFREYQAMREELEDARLKLAERKVVEKAKGLLMQRKGLDEDTAYRLLRKLAMDKNKRIAEVAEQILSVAELLN